MSNTFEDISTIKKDRRSLSRCSNLKNPTTAPTAAIQSIASARSRSDDGSCSVQVKLVISKRELKQMLTSMGWGRMSAAGNNFHRPVTAAALEELLHVLRKRHMKRSECNRSSIKWQPALQSIPEEL